MSPRGRIWWFLRMRKAYRKHGVEIKSLRETWADAMFAHPARRGRHRLWVAAAREGLSLMPLPFLHRNNEGSYLIWRFTRRHWLLLGAWKARS